MSDKLKKFITENEAEFDALPHHGHFERFKQRLLHEQKHSQPKQTTGTLKNSMPTLMKVASVVILLVGIGWLSFNLGKLEGSQEFASKNNKANEVFTSELAEAELFFNEQLTQKKKEVLAYTTADNEATRQIMRELEKLEVQYIGLKEELAINAENELIIHAMVENYRMRISLLEKLLKQLKKSNRIKKQHHENIHA